MTALFNVQVLDWQRKRDYFPAELCAIAMNKRRTVATDKVWTADDFLDMRYPRIKKSVIITPSHDPDHGALGGEELRTYLKASTEVKQRRRKKVVKP